MAVERTEAQKEAARKNGLMGGRPKKTSGRAEELRIRDRARRQAKVALPEVVRFWKDIMRGKVAAATAADKLRASENLADRGGLPRLAQQQVQTDTPVKLFDVPGLAPPLPAEEDQASEDPASPEPESPEPGPNGQTAH